MEGIYAPNKTLSTTAQLKQIRPIQRRKWQNSKWTVNFGKTRICWRRRKAKRVRQINIVEGGWERAENCVFRGPKFGHSLASTPQKSFFGPFPDSTSLSSCFGGQKRKETMPSFHALVSGLNCATNICTDLRHYYSSLSLWPPTAIKCK
jgi:hypothetical protein